MAASTHKVQRVGRSMRHNALLTRGKRNAQPTWRATDVARYSS
ncbi:hypothetical protein HMPREF3192_00451 [Atopobium deltae]|uniref:Uncharacterized protein n=1 Tax=Atopobium deltae TaxID=1393034 RepID=A0A133XVX9_9ACTN|nr:hypothetical protein HMPREF3192_00451 [Atopobium deltae]